MSISVDGHSRVPPGFRFHPTEEELLNYYLRKKVASEKIDLDVIRDVDLNKLEPWDIQEKCRIGSTPQNDWYFFSHKDKKYPTGTRTNRATAAGFWKATGRDKVIYTTVKRIGMRKTLVFYKGRAPHGQKSDWIMHEYRLDDNSDGSSFVGELLSQEDGWVICRVFKKKSCASGASNESKAQMIHSASDGTLDQILQYMGRSCKQETGAMAMGNGNGAAAFRYLHHERFMKLPALESPPLPLELPPTHEAAYPMDSVSASSMSYHAESGLSDWAALDRLVASHLNGQSEVSRQLACFDDPIYNHSNRLLVGAHDYHHQHATGGDGDLWSFARSASAPTMSDHMSDVSHASP